MEHLYRFWSHIASHPDDIGWAAFFGFFFWAVFDLVSSDGRIRTGIRILKNKWSERSTSKLRKRIIELEKQRDSVAVYVSSDKALYLATFQVVLGMLMVISLGGMFSEIGRIVDMNFFHFLSGYFYLIVFIAGIYGVNISALDTRAKVIEAVSKRNDEIQSLRQKLEKKKSI